MRWVQSTLNMVMNLRLLVNGFMGLETRSAVRDFQRREGLAVDGILGPDTKKALIAARRQLSITSADGQTNAAAGGQPPGPPDGQPGQEGEEQFLGPVWDWLTGSERQVDRNSLEYIRWLQQLLNKIMGLRLAVDGVSGSKTRSAIRDFQRKNGLSADGIAGSNTERALIAAGAGRPPRTSTSAKTTSFRYVKDFSGPNAECVAALRRAGKTKAEALTIVNAQIGVAIVMLRKAAKDLKRGRRSSGTTRVFRKIFRVRPKFVPTWLNATATIKDRGDVVATRCKRVADLLASGKIKFFCTINSTNCPDCSNDPSGYACSSWGDESVAPGKSNVVCLGNAFWDDMKAGRTSSMLSTLMHEPFHIYYGKYVTAHRSDAGKFGGINCIVQFVFETNGRVAPARVSQRCKKTAVRNEVDEIIEEAALEIYPQVDAYEVFDPGLTGETWAGELNRKNRSFIRWVQAGLNKIMGLRLAVDGISGSKTRSAVRDFQQKQGLLADGIVGPNTERALVAAGAGRPPHAGTSPGTTPTVSGAALRSKIVQLANQEWQRWQQGRIKESDPRMRQVLENYWRKGAGWLPDDPAWWTNYPWSAAFISWVMRQAGAGNNFKYSAAHAVYTKAAKDNRLAGNQNPFKAYRVSDVAPQPGDIVCKSRAGSGATYDNIRSGMKTHCDIVTAVQPGRLTTIGGNVSDSVSRTYVDTDANGRIAKPGYFAVIKAGSSSP